MNVHWNLEPFLWPWPCHTQQAHLFTRQSRWCAIKASLVAERSAVPRIKSYSDYMILYLEDSISLHLRQQTNLLERQWLMIMQNHTNFCNKRLKNISSGQTFIDLSFATTLTLNTAIQFLHKALRLMIMYHQTKFDSKRINISEDIYKYIYVH